MSSPLKAVSTLRERQAAVFGSLGDAGSGWEVREPTQLNRGGEASQSERDEEEDEEDAERWALAGDDAELPSRAFCGFCDFEDETDTLDEFATGTADERPPPTTCVEDEEGFLPSPSLPAVTHVRAGWTLYALDEPLDVQRGGAKRSATEHLDVQRGGAKRSATELLDEQRGGAKQVRTSFL